MASGKTDESFTYVQASFTLHPLRKYALTIKILTLTMPSKITIITIQQHPRLQPMTSIFGYLS